MQNDASITSLQDIFEQHCDSVGMKKEDPILAHTERIRALHRVVPALGVRPSSLAISPHDLTSPFLPQRPELWNGRQEIFDEVSTKMVPDDILKKVRPFPSSPSSNPNPSLFSS